MKKTNTEKIDRNTNISDYFSNSTICFPNTAVKTQTGVEIIELHSSNTSLSNDDDSLNLAHRHAWSYIDKYRPYTNENNCNINNSARERRRMRNKVCPEVINQHFDYFPNDRKFSQFEKGNSDYNSMRSNAVKENVLPFSPLNRFTIHSNEFLDSDQSLSDSENGLEIIQCGDVILEDYLRVNKDPSEDITNNDKNIENNVKRTIWIYSFKNRNLLSQDMKQPRNIINEDSTSSSSPENFENSSEYRDRIASPIPASYIPKLDLYVAATLPTVREVAEPYQFTFNNGETCNIKKDTQNLLTPVNNWFINKNHDKKEESFSKMEPNLSSNHTTIPSDNVINWMSLSPREHKRNIYVKNSIEYNNTENDELTHIQKSKKDTVKDASNVDGDLTYVKTKSDEVINEVLLKGDKGLNIDEQLKIDSIDEKGDYNKSFQLKKPFINFKKVLVNKMKTDTIEKLNRDDWIEHTSEHTHEISFEIEDKNTENDIVRREEITKCTGDRLFTKNMSLLKPVGWSQYLPITESIPSLHLSLPSDINEEKQSWYKYFIKYIICCKKCK